jgi:Zn-finger nucleic acid-binding protein
MNCPRCDKVMAQVRTKEGVPVLRCPKCQGHWMEGEDLKVLEGTVEARMVEWRRLPSPEVQAREIHCPRCRPHLTLKKVKNERDRHVLLDVCEQCQGVWLDGGELEAIQRMGLVRMLVDAVRFIART